GALQGRDREVGEVHLVAPVEVAALGGGAHGRPGKECLTFAHSPTDDNALPAVLPGEDGGCVKLRHKVFWWFGATPIVSEPVHANRFRSNERRQNVPARPESARATARRPARKGALPHGEKCATARRRRIRMCPAARERRWSLVESSCAAAFRQLRSCSAHL